MSALKLSPAHAPTTMSRIGTQVFAGNLLLFAPSPAMRNLLAQVRKVARECFDISHPPHAHRKYSRDEFLRRAEDAQKRVNTAECKQLFAAVLDGLGISRKNLFWDTLGLRVAPPIQNADDLALRGFRSFVPVHRDTWGAGFQSQINWWAPVWSLAARRTMGFYPSYWMRPLRNTSAEWSFREFLASRKRAANGSAAAYPSAPNALENPDESPVPLRMRPGELLCFSSAHLHTSIANATALTRFSLEIRTLHLDDLRRNRGAPNADNESRCNIVGLFSSAADGAPLKTKWNAPAAV